MHRPPGKLLGLLLLASSCSGLDDSEAPADASSDTASSDAQEVADHALEAAPNPDASGPVDGAPEGGVKEAAHDEQEHEASGPCPGDMLVVGTACVDRYEAPNVAGELPLVMFHFDEAHGWCVHRGKRLCFDDEWTAACAGPEGYSYPYGDEHTLGVCNDDKAWLAYNQTLLNGWPWSLETEVIESLGQLLEAAGAKGAGAKAAADHVLALYQGAPGGATSGCVGSAGVYDLTGNVEEWTRRRDGGEPGFRGKLKGRYWSEPRTCQMGVVTHGDTFRFYEIGFRCCRDANGQEP